MFVRGCLLSVSVLAIWLVACTTLPAQRPQVRKGFWANLGFGLDNVAWQCDGCPKRSQGSRSLVLRVGWTLNKKALLGVELNGSVIGQTPSFDSLDQQVRARVATIAASWYPSAAGGLFLKAGVGRSWWYNREQGTSTNAESAASAILVGAGYDLRVGRMISITPMLTLWGSLKADLKDGSTTDATNFRNTVAAFQVGATFH